MLFIVVAPQFMSYKVARGAHAARWLATSSPTFHGLNCEIHGPLRPAAAKRALEALARERIAQAEEDAYWAEQAEYAAMDEDLYHWFHA